MTFKCIMTMAIRIMTAIIDSEILSRGIASCRTLSRWTLFRGHRTRSAGRTSRTLAAVVASMIVVAAAPAQPACGQQPAARQQATRAPRLQDETAIRAAIRTYQEALERGDGTALAALWTPDGDIIDDQGEVLKGRETVGLTKAPLGGSARPALHLHETSLRFLTADVAIEDGTVEVTPPGAAAPHKGHFSATWVRHEGSWKLAGLRESRIDSPQDTPRLADLGWMVGDWTIVEEHPARESDDGEDSPKQAAAEQPTTPAAPPTIEVSVRWNANHTFLIRDMKISVAALADTSDDGLPPMHITQRIGWDPLSRQIRSWVFGSDGSHGEATWTREGTAWIARTTAVLPDGTQTSTLNIYVYDGGDRCMWRSLPTHVGGEHMPQVTMTMIRKQRGPSQ